jgi:DHA2 family multidrug resistance protein-like MFS transporter
VYRLQVASGLPAGAAVDAAQDSLAGGVALAATLPEPLGNLVLIAAREAYTSGLHVVAGASAVVLLGVAVLALSMLREVRPIGATQLTETADGRVPASELAAA